LTVPVEVPVPDEVEEVELLEAVPAIAKEPVEA
jgi:hypothetical protein